MQIYKLQLSNKVIDVFIERKKIRNYYIKINPDLTVSVPIPLTVDINLIYDFINNHKKWIEKNLNKFEKAKEANIKDTVTNGGTVKILDSQYIVYIYDAKQDNVVMDGFNIYIYSKKSNDQNYLIKQYNGFLKNQAKEYFQNKINKFLPIFKKYNVKTPVLKVKTMKSKWGSCVVQTAQITLNLHLYKASDKCIEYVVFHEMIHLIHSGHKKRFYNFMQKYIPDYKEIEKELDYQTSQLLY